MIGNGNTGQAASNANHAALYGAGGGREIKRPKRGPVGKTCSSACRKILHRRMRAQSIELEAPNDDGTGLPRHIDSDRLMNLIYVFESGDATRFADVTFSTLANVSIRSDASFMASSQKLMMLRSKSLLFCASNLNNCI